MCVCVCVCIDKWGEKRSEGGKEQCDKVLARGGELTEGGRIYEQGEEWTEREGEETETEEDKDGEKKESAAMTAAPSGGT